MVVNRPIENQLQAYFDALRHQSADDSRLGEVDGRSARPSREPPVSCVKDAAGQWSCGGSRNRRRCTCR